MSNYNFPKLPVPDLNQTLKKYIESIRPLVSSEQFTATDRITNKFLTTEGPYLQSLLLKRAANTDNWLLEWWNEVAYLSVRLPLPVYLSPVAASEKIKYIYKSQRLDIVSLFINRYCEFFETIRKNELPQDKLGDTPLCMRQYKSLPGGHRVPGEVKDTHRFSPNSDHIIVMYQGHCFKFPVFGYRNGNRYILGSHEIKHSLSLLVDSPLLPSEPIGVLTSLDRDSWYKARKELKKSRINCDTLEAIETSLFGISLEDGADESKEYYLKSAMIGDMRNDFSSYNRWFDIGIQSVFTSDGYCGHILEHSISDGPPSIELANRGTYAAITGNVSVLPVNSQELPKVEHLKWEVSRPLRDYIQKAKYELKKLSEKLDLKIYKFTEFGKDFSKRYKLSHDSIVQLAIQLTFYKLHGEPTACYESVSTRKFYDGRTDTLRSTSNESTRLIKALLSPTSTDFRLRLLREYVRKHEENSRQVFNGQGIDRHLLGLKLIADQENLQPEFFSDPAFSKSTRYRMSTSQVPNPLLSSLAFGPVVEDGYGVCYNPHGAFTYFSFTSYTTCQDTVSADKLKNVMIESVKDVKELVQSIPLPAKL